MSSRRRAATSAGPQSEAGRAAPRWRSHACRSVGADHSWPTAPPPAGSKSPGQSRAAPSRRGRDRARQRRGDQSLEQREPQERPQPGGQTLSRPRSEVPALAGHEPADVADTQILELAAGVLRQEQRRRPHVLDDCLRGEAALGRPGRPGIARPVPPPRTAVGAEPGPAPRRCPSGRPSATPTPSVSVVTIHPSIEPHGRTPRLPPRLSSLAASPRR